MLFLASLVVAVGVTLFAVSHIAKMLQAERYQMVWVLMASVVSILLASIVLIPLRIYVEGLDKQQMMIASGVVFLLISSFIFKLVNKMSWLGAITTNIANLFIGLMTLVAAVVLNGQSIEKTYQTVSANVQNSSQMIEAVATGKEPMGELIEVDHATNINNSSPSLLSVDDESFVEEEGSDSATSDSEEEAKVSELDLLPEDIATAIKSKYAIRYIEPKYLDMRVRSINQLIGYPIRISQYNGQVTAGLLTKIKDSKAVLSRRIESGEALLPISISSIKKLEVYR